MALRRNANTDRDVEGRDTRALGQIMQPNGVAATKPGSMRTDPATGKTQQFVETTGMAGANASGYGWIDRNLGSVMAPAVGTEPPVAKDSPEFNQRVLRNKQFLQSPEISAGLMQMGLNLMSGGDIGNAIGGGMEAMGQVATNRDAQTLLDRKMNIEERGMNLDEDKQTLEEQKFKLEAIKAGGRTYSKLVSGDSPIGLELGLGKGERARVKFTEDLNGNIIAADMEANPIEGDGGKGTQVTKLLDEAAAAAQAGDMNRAALLRTAAEKEATGRTTAVTLKEGQRLVTDETGEHIENIPGSDADIKQKEQDKAAGGKRVQEIQTAINVRRGVNKALSMILSSNLPPDLVLTGFGSYLNYVRGTGANDLALTLETVKSNLGFMKLQDIRDAATKTGGGLGPVSDFENRLLQATVAQLDASLKSEYIVDNLMYVKAIFTDVEYDGKLTELGKLVESGDMPEARAVELAGEYLDNKVKELKVAQANVGRDLTTKPPPAQAPSGAKGNEAGVYHYLPPSKQQRMQELIEKRGSK